VLWEDDETLCGFDENKRQLRRAAGVALQRFYDDFGDEPVGGPPRKIKMLGDIIDVQRPPRLPDKLDNFLL